MNIEWSQAITIILFMIVHLTGTVWWMSKIQTTLSFLAQQVGEIVKTVAAHEATYAKKEDVAKDCIVIQRQVDAIWKRLDNPHACPNQVTHGQP
jgi:hypothetical protein